MSAVKVAVTFRHTQPTAALKDYADLYSAIDSVIDKLQRQVQKQKEKTKLNRRRAKE